MDVLTLQALLAHPRRTALVVLLQPLVNLIRNGLQQHAGRVIPWLVARLLTENPVQAAFRISGNRILVRMYNLRDSLSVDLELAGDRPQAHLIYSIVVKNLFVNVHIDH